MWPTRSHQLRIVLAASLAGLASVPAPGAACQVEEVRVTVVVVLATTDNNKVCPTLDCLAKEVQKKRPELKGFCQGPQVCKLVPVGREDTFDLVELQNAVITVRHGANAKGWVCLKVKAPGVGDITYTAMCGKFFPIVTGYQTRKNETLILAIRVEPCKKK